jgi:hypothetical protein
VVGKLFSRIFSQESSITLSSIGPERTRLDWHLWPKSLNKSVVVGIFLNAIEERIGEEALLEMRPEELDAVELICRLRGISYEELCHQAIEAWRNRENFGEEDEETDDDQDESDQWKEA